MTNEYDVIVVGSGPVGENVADRAVQGGLTVALVEVELVGGECSYWACEPSKALLRPVLAQRAAAAVRGVEAGRLDVPEILERRSDFVDHWSDAGQSVWVDQAGIALVRGHGRISAVREVTVTAADGTERVLTARHAVAISTGSDAFVPDIEGLRAAEPWTSREATSAKEVPGRLAIIGGGVVGVEMATAYAGFGAEVTLIAERGLLTSSEPFVGELLAESLTSQGVRVLLGAAVTRVRRTANGGSQAASGGDRSADGGGHAVDGGDRTADGGDTAVGVTIETADGTVIEADEVLAATGRRPRTGDIGLDVVGLEPGSWIDVDDTMLVRGFDWLYAVGDVTRRALVTHQGKYQARAAGDVIAARAQGRAVSDGAWGTHVATADHRAVPQVVFADPEIASVGLTAAAAIEQGYEIRTVDYDLGQVSGSKLHADQYAGRARMVVDEQRKVLLGLTLAGPDVGELLHAATIAIVAEVPLDRLWHAVPAFPTISEIWLRLLESYGRP
ncbi:dihydrolipoyl dehydrogenase family protein [Kribbella endophytica]